MEIKPWDLEVNTNQLASYMKQTYEIRLKKTGETRTRQKYRVKVILGDKAVITDTTNKDFIKASMERSKEKRERKFAKQKKYRAELIAKKKELKIKSKELKKLQNGQKTELSRAMRMKEKGEQLIKAAESKLKKFA